MHYISYANRRDPDSKREGQLASRKKQKPKYDDILTPKEMILYKGNTYSVSHCKNGDLHLRLWNPRKKSKK